MTALDRYMQGLADGSIIAPNYIKKWYLEYIRPLVLGKDSMYYFDPKLAKAPLLFGETFIKMDDAFAGKPLRFCLFQAAKWEAFYGIRDKETGNRKFDEIFDLRGRKNGKTSEYEPIVLYELLFHPGSKAYSAATSFAQARILIDKCISAIRQSPELKKRFAIPKSLNPHVIPFVSTSKYAVAHHKALSEFLALSSTTKNKDGLNASFGFVDEAHALSREIYDLLVQSMGARPSGTTILSIATTDGFVRGGLFDDRKAFSIKVLKGLIDAPHFFPLLYVLDDPDREWDNPQMWIKANPSLGVIKQMDRMMTEYQGALADPNQMSTFKTKDLNITGVAEGAYLTADEIMKGRFGPYSEDEIGEAGTEKQEQWIKDHFDRTVVLGGYDLSKTGDLTAFTTMMFDREKKTVVCKTMYWASSRFLNSSLARTSGVPFQAWIDRGLLRVAGEGEISPKAIAGYLDEMVRTHRYIYDKIEYDPWSTVFLTDLIDELGFSKDSCQDPVRQGSQSLTIPTTKLKSLLYEGRMCYLNNPITMWCLSNLQVKKDETNKGIKPIKVDENSANKIDGAATIIDCLYQFAKDEGYYLRPLKKKN